MLQEYKRSWETGSVISRNLASMNSYLSIVLETKKKRGWRKEQQRKRGQRGSWWGSMSSPKHSSSLYIHTQKNRNSSWHANETLNLVTETAWQSLPAGTPADLSDLSSLEAPPQSTSQHFQQRSKLPCPLQVTAAKSRKGRKEKGFQQSA